MKTKKTILIAGGTGLVGTPLTNQLRKKGHEVRVLTRGKSDASKQLYNWDPKAESIDEYALENVEIIINLAGAGIADARWTSKRKEVLINSRVVPALFLNSLVKKLPTFKQYISASGINCYGYKQPDRLHQENDPYGDDFLSSVVKLWESAADTMKPYGKVVKVRTSVVLSNDGGALPKIASPIKKYFGAPLGNGNQPMPWITIEDLIRIFEHAIDNELDGTYNALADNSTNKIFTEKLAKQLRKPLWLPSVPSFVLKLFLGEMSILVLDGVQADNSKLKNTGFEFKYNSLEEAFEGVYRSPF